MKTFSDIIIESAKETIGYPIATSITTVDYEERKFIAESMLVGATLFLLNIYFKAYFEGLGLEKMAKRHGKATQSLMLAIQNKQGLKGAIASAKKVLNKTYKNPKISDDKVSAREKAEKVLADTIYENGASSAQAKNVAKKLVSDIEKALLETSNSVKKE